MRFFRPEVQRIINMMVIGAVVGALALPITWGYRQRQEARTWRETACAYRLREVIRRTNSMVTVTVRDGADACVALARLGLDVTTP
jgi:hypothetical protein